MERAEEIYVLGTHNSIFVLYSRTKNFCRVGLSPDHEVYEAYTGGAEGEFRRSVLRNAPSN